MPNDLRLKKRFKELVNRVKFFNRDSEGKQLTHEVIAKSLGYELPYFNSLVGKSGKVIQKHIDKLLEVYPDVANDENVTNSNIEERRLKKLLLTTHADEDHLEGIPVFDVPIDASFIERYNDTTFYEPMYRINIPKLRNCNFGAIVSGSSMYPVMKSGSIALCRVVEDLNYFDAGEMYFLSTVNGFETVKYVQPTDDPNELKLIPHNEKISPTIIHKGMVLKMCIVEAWLNFR